MTSVETKIVSKFANDTLTQIACPTCGTMTNPKRITQHMKAKYCITLGKARATSPPPPPVVPVHRIDDPYNYSGVGVTKDNDKLKKMMFG